MGIASINNHNNHSVHSELSHSLGQMNLGFHGLPGFHPQSLPEHHNGITNGIAYNSNAMSATGSNINVRPSEGMDNRIFHKVGSGSLNGHSFDHNEGGKCDKLFISFALRYMSAFSLHFDNHHSFSGSICYGRCSFNSPLNLYPNP